MTIEQFFIACQTFDWFYQYSDDHRVWRAGDTAEKKLQAEASSDPIKRKILTDWSIWINDRKTDKPELGNYIPSVA